MKIINLGISTGKYKNPFITITTSKRTIIFEVHTCFSNIFIFRKFIDAKSKGFFHLNLSILTITNFMR